MDELMDELMDEKIERILIAAKPHGRGLPVSTEHARNLARSFDAELALLSCVDASPSAATSGFAGSDPGEATVLPIESAQQAQAALEKLAQPLRDAGVAVTTRVSTRLPVHTGILEQVEEWRADLLVIGFHEPTLVPHTRLTEVDWQLMRLCPCPLLLVRDPGTVKYETILAAVDPLLEHAEPPALDRAVLGAAAEFENALDARLCVANVYPHPEEFEIASAVEVEPGVFYGAENIEGAHGQAVGALLEDCGLADRETILRAGKPADVIREIAAECQADLVVLGSVKRGALQTAMLGSTAEALIAGAPFDLLLVKPPPG